MASESMRQHDTPPRAAAEATSGPLPLAVSSPQSAALRTRRPDARSLASVAAGDGRVLWCTAETTPAGAA